MKIQKNSIRKSLNELSEIGGTLFSTNNLRNLHNNNNDLLLRQKRNHSYQKKLKVKRSKKRIGVIMNKNPDF